MLRCAQIASSCAFPSMKSRFGLVVIPVLYSVMDRKEFVKAAAGSAVAKPLASPLAVHSKRED